VDRVFDRKNKFQKGMRAAVVNIILNLVLAGVKILTGFLGNSYALIADGIESLLDIFSSTIVWGGLKIGSLPPDNNHPYGHGRAESLAGMMVSVTLILVAFGIAAHSIKEIFVPHHAPAAFTLFTLIGVVVIKEMMYQFLWKTGNDLKSLSIKVDAWHARSDALTSLAAFIGISIALIAGKGYESADDWAALFASGVILFNGSKILRSSIEDIMDSAVSPETENAFKNIARTVPGVLDVEKCRIRKSGLNFFVEMHIVVNGDIPIKKGHQIAHEVKKALMDSEPHILDVLTHIEPHEYN